MMVKTNDSTHNRPEGHRLIDAPAVLVDLEEYLDQLKDEKAWKKNDRNAITVFKTPGLTFVLVAFHKGAEINDLQLEGVVVLQVIKGSIVVSGDDGVQNGDEENVTVKKNQMLVLQPENQHRLVAAEDTVVLLTAMKEPNPASPAK